MEKINNLIKQITIVIFLTLNIFTVFGQGMTKDEQKVVSNFINCIKNNQKEKLVSKIAFPFEREYPIPKIKNRKEFIKRYDEIFDSKLTHLIINSNLSKDWSAVGWRGIMLLNGYVWLDYEGRLIAINYQSEIETKKKAELIKIDKTQLHETIKNFNEPILILETKKYRIRIDKMGENKYRYCSWNLENKMSDKPDLIIQNGEYVPDGSGGNHSYIFKNGEFKYECSIIIMGEEGSPPAFLTISKGETELLSQKANIVKK